MQNQVSTWGLEGIVDLLRKGSGWEESSGASRRSWNISSSILWWISMIFSSETEEVDTEVKWIESE